MPRASWEMEAMPGKSQDPRLQPGDRAAASRRPASQFAAGQSTAHMLLKLARSRVYFLQPTPSLAGNLLFSGRALHNEAHTGQEICPGN